MKLNEIAKAAATLSIDPDECRILAAACKVAADYVTGAGTPTVNPFEDLAGAFETPAGKMASCLLGPLLEGYAVAFEAAGMAACLHDDLAIKPKDRAEFALTGLRTHGTGWHFPSRETESEADDVR